jgi:hypothetical protein
MDKITSKKELLNSIRLAEGTSFQYNEEAILHEYELQKENKSSLAIKVLSIVGGFLATLAFLGFLFIAGLYESELGMILFGLGLITSALILNRIYSKLIIDTFSVSSYVIGITLLIIGLFEMDFNENSVTLLIIFIAIISLLITQNYILSFIAILSVSCSFLTLMFSNDLYNLIHLYIAFNVLMLTALFRYESKLITFNAKVSKLYNPIRIGLIVSLLAGLISIGRKHLIPISENHVWLSSILMILVIIYLVNRILIITEIKAVKSKLLIYLFTGLILISLLFSPSILGAIVILLLSFLVNYKTGLTIGVISLIYFISQYYYDLNFTLLTKSILLLSSGIVFLLFYVLITKNSISNEKI